MKKYFIYSIGCFAVFAVFLYLWVNKNEKNLQSKEQQPFSVCLEKAEIVEDISEWRSEKRLLIDISIENESADNYPDTECVLRLNEEVRPYIASQIMETPRVKSDIYSLEECLASNEKGIQQPDDRPRVYAFNHSWSMLLTGADVLRTDYELEPSGIYTALKNMEVEIRWDGGSQREVLEIELNEAGE